MIFNLHEIFDFEYIIKDIDNTFATIIMKRTNKFTNNNLEQIHIENIPKINCHSLQMMLF